MNNTPTPETPGKTAIRILLADDHTLVRAGFKALLEDQPDFKVVAETSDGREVPRLVREAKPDVALLDIAMPDNGLDVAARLRTEAPAVKVIILSMYVNQEYIRRALDAGVAGYLVKDSAPAELEISIRAVMRGEVYLSPTVTTQVLDRYVKQPGRGAPPPITARQRAVLVGVARGLTTKAIARELGISVKTVEAHRTQIMDRLKIHDVAGLTRYALRAGLISLDSRDP
ncbi:MAG TPA: response regulator transcription factor [Isosphaeraceae bacterium]|nr:response regulator transcription factor [Isosphaeraceae bacterium]